MHEDKQYVRQLQRMRHASETRLTPVLAAHYRHSVLRT